MSHRGEKTMKKIKIIIILSILLCLFSLLFCETQAEPPTNFRQSNAGTSSNPYLISSLENLRWLSETASVWSSHFLQTADIDASETRHWRNGWGFRRIGIIYYSEIEDDFIMPFRGTYDGNNYSISNMYQTDVNDLGHYFSSTSYLSMFGDIVGATIKNVKLEDIDFIAKDN